MTQAIRPVTPVLNQGTRPLFSNLSPVLLQMATLLSHAGKSRHQPPPLQSGDIIPGKDHREVWNIFLGQLLFPMAHYFGCLALLGIMTDWMREPKYPDLYFLIQFPWDCPPCWLQWSMLHWKGIKFLHSSPTGAGLRYTSWVWSESYLTT